MIETDFIGNYFSKKYNLASEYFKDGNFLKSEEIINSIEKKIILENIKLHRPKEKKSIETKVSIIIVTHKEENETGLAKLIESIHPLLVNNEFELIVINNHPNGDPLKLHTFSLGQVIVNVGFNYGCSGGRNIGASIATGKYILFLDDDGDTTPESVMHLIDCIESNDVVGCRGRIISNDINGISGGHYDKGNQVIPSIIDTEGFSIWEKETFIQNGGFNPLMAGHEGLEICHKISKSKKNALFLYTPKAIFSHNFSDDINSYQEKLKKHKAIEEYLEFKGINVASFRRHYKRNKIRHLIRSMFSFN